MLDSFVQASVVDSASDLGLPLFSRQNGDPFRARQKGKFANTLRANEGPLASGPHPTARSFGVSDPKEFILKVVGIHSHAVIFDAECACILIDADPYVLRVRIPRVRNRLP